jgi:small GTP-binding protein
MSGDEHTAEPVAPPPRGFKLRRVLRAPGRLTRFAWSPDGRLIAAPSSDSVVFIWDVETGELSGVLKGHTAAVNAVAWGPDGKSIATGSDDRTCKVWDVASGECSVTFDPYEMDYVHTVAWSPDGELLASGSFNGTVRLFQPDRKKARGPYQHSKASVVDLSWSPDGRVLASGTTNAEIALWDLKQGRVDRVLRGHTGIVYTLAWSRDGRVLASGSEDATVRLWDAELGKQFNVLEAHTEKVSSISFSFDGRYLASKSFDGTVRLWRCEDWNTLAVMHEPVAFWSDSLAFHPHRHTLATYGMYETAIRIWDLDSAVLEGAKAEGSVHYASAKIALVGDSGVGKTGLGWRLAHGEFKEHPSTHGQQFWVIDELGKKRTDGTECEAVLWDLAGQPDYRLVHSLFLDDVDLALVVFDPANREKPLSGVEFWLKQLSKREEGVRRSLLVGARVDRGSATLTAQELEEFCRGKGVTGGYVATSAVRGDGLPELMNLIKSQIPWDEMPATITTATFKRVKEYVLSLKEEGGRSDEGGSNGAGGPAGLLVSPEELRARLLALDAEWEFTDAEMMTAVRHLSTHGYVTILRASAGEESILLAPDVLVNLASSFVLEARRDPLGLGVLEEDRLLRGGYTFKELSALSEPERETLLDAAAALFLKHNLCFRETFNEQTFLVFPSLINEKRPRFENVTTADDVSYRVTGAVENVYAALVVLLGYTNTFTRKHQWQNQAQYELGKDEVCGFRQAAEHEGEVELVLYYGEPTPLEVRQLFQGLFERFLKRRDVSIVRFPSVACTKCGKRQERSVVMNQIQEGSDTLFCNKCGTNLRIPKESEITALPRHAARLLNEEQLVAGRRTAFAEAVVWVKSILRERGDDATRPSCFVSYAWGDAAHEKWVLTLAKDMRDAGIGVILDRWHNPPGASIVEFIERIEASDYVVAVGTPNYLAKYAAKDEDRVVNAEFRLVGTRLRMRTEVRERVVPVLLDGDEQSSFPPLLRDSVFVDFRTEKDYFVNLFKLILTVYRIPFDHPNLEDLLEKMR